MTMSIEAPRNPRNLGRRRVDLSDTTITFAGQQLRARRLQLGLSQEALAKRLGVSFQQVQKYERGANRLAIDQIGALMRILDVPASFFFEDENGERRPVVEVDWRRERQSAALVRAFNAIGDDRQRQAVLRLAKAMAGDADSASADQEAA